jgi:predicted Fe-Mo cluster-binding NifX family protein
MRIVVSAEGHETDSRVSSIFGRCPVYVFVDTDTMEIESFPNPAQNAPGGAGIQAAQFVVSRGTKAVLTGNVGPKAADVLAAAGVEVRLVGGMTVEEAVQAFAAGQLLGAGPNQAARAEEPSLAVSSSEPPKEDIAKLGAKLAQLRRRLAEIMTRIDVLQKEE